MSSMPALGLPGCVARRPRHVHEFSRLNSSADATKFIRFLIGATETSAVILKNTSLPYHPLWKQGYVSIGDWHTTRSLAEVESPDELRFFGLKRECGLHE